jgi:hypothetical protein
MQTISNETYIGKIFPPFSDEVAPLRTNSGGAKAGKIFYAILGSIIVGGVVWFVGLLFDLKLVRYGGIALGVYSLIASIRAMLVSLCAACPYCQKDQGAKSLVHLSADDKQKQFACENCFEWLVSDGGQVRAFRESDIGERKVFSCPVFGNGIWPEECIVCGTTATRKLRARTFNVGLASLLVGRLSVSYGSVKNIPYCDSHEGAVTVKGVDGKIWADFNDYAAMRRYLHANKQRRAGAPTNVPVKELASAAA